jgi:hypothetical protein
MDTIRKSVSFLYNWEFAFSFVAGAVILESHGFGWLYQASARSGSKDPFWL